MVCKAEVELQCFCIYNDTKPTHAPKVLYFRCRFCYLSGLFHSISYFETKYEIAFLRCSCELSNIERKQIIRKHESASEIASNGKRREKYSSMDAEEEQEVILNTCI